MMPLGRDESVYYEARIEDDLVRQKKPGILK